ncbi:DUF1622 domain-containing protein [Mucilaginibacter terrae]|uniref:Membrane protein n=1 Tax=Mucilaginibacter terrae TaxID=1955052 RepID=A0ABU3GQS1_9SPHI|nr:DUF1622 domain-containing protein [Mucilaginibacter terrae]MDT3402137.1 putative membrane protein [Mucilaginibacter terrae]
MNIELSISTLVHALRLAVEIMGAVTIAAGSVSAFIKFCVALVKNRHADFNTVRLTLARYLALALEFQLGADIISTAIAPGWEEIGKLGAIAIIRTGLNYFLTKELAEEKAASHLKS